jgi:hypothetical protein
MEFLNVCSMLFIKKEKYNTIIYNLLNINQNILLQSFWNKFIIYKIHTLICII